MERFLYRLSRSVDADHFILKGALMLRAWRSPETRPTMDIDLLGRMSNETSVIVSRIRDILSIAVEPGGLVFDAGSVQAEQIAEGTDYRGVRVRFRGKLDSAVINMQIDIGFGDIVYPEPEQAYLPTVLGSPEPRLWCYSRESVIAEKFEIMVKLGKLNSRMKDFFDIWLLSRGFYFDGARLAEAIRLTFERRRTGLPSGFEAFDNSFIAVKQVQWTAFCRRIERESLPTSFDAIAAAVKGFLEPILRSSSEYAPLRLKWNAPGPWVQSGGEREGL